MKNKFCCIDTEARWSLNRSGGINFRVFKTDYVNSYEPEMLPPYQYYMTSGYKLGDRGKDVMVIKVNYCPFCGSRLSKFYNSDFFVNEMDDTVLHY